MPILSKMGAGISRGLGKVWAIRQDLMCLIRNFVVVFA